LNPNYRQTLGLINYWPFYLNANDKVNVAHLYNGINTFFTTDRNGRALSAVTLATGCFQIPPGNYFSSTNFSILVWIKIKSFTSYPRLLSFATGLSGTIDYIYISTSAGTSRNPIVDIYKSGSAPGFVSSKFLPLNQWTHIGFTFAKPSLYLYLNGILDGSLTKIDIPNNGNYVSNYLGRSEYYPNEADLNSDVDELKFFNRALSQEEILYEMNNDMYY
jgi:hypothetical protein